MSRPARTVGSSWHPAGVAAHETKPAPVMLLVGEEDFLADRAISRIVASVREQDPEAEASQLTPDDAVAGRLAELTQPSLFGERRVIVLRSAQDLGKDAVTEVSNYLGGPSDDVTLVLVHAGGKKGAKLLETAKKAGAATITCAKLTRMRERIDFVRAEVHGAGRTITEEAARSLLDAVGTDLRELANACSQLVADTAGAIDEDAVARYHRGRADVTGFTVADRAIEGRTTDAMEHLRWALQMGVSPVLVTSALAQGLRSLAKVAGASGRGPGLARELGLPPWKVDRARQQLRGWGPEGLSDALRAVAKADAQVKGGGADPEYAVERAVFAVIAARER